MECAHTGDFWVETLDAPGASSGMSGSQSACKRVGDTLIELDIGRDGTRYRHRRISSIAAVFLATIASILLALTFFHGSLPDGSRNHPCRSLSGCQERTHERNLLSSSPAPTAPAAMHVPTPAARKALPQSPFEHQLGRIEGKLELLLQRVRRTLGRAQVCVALPPPRMHACPSLFMQRSRSTHDF